MRKLSITKCFNIVFVAIYFVFGQYTIHSQENNNSTNSHQAQTNQNITITEPVKVSLEPDREEIEAEKGYKARQEKRDEANATWSRAGIIINSLLFVLVLIQAIVSHRQLKAMNSQVGVMQEGLIETRKIIEQNERAVKANETQADLMREAIEETKRITEMTERPIVVVESVTAYMMPNQPIKPVITLVNKGRTAAKNLSISFQFAKPGHHINYPQSYESPVQIPFLAANDGIAVESAPADAVTFNDDDFYAITEGKETLLVYGRGSYKDMTDKDYVIEEYAFRFDKQYGFIPADSIVSLWKTNETIYNARNKEDNPD